jgi:hypothetical protein
VSFFCRGHVFSLLEYLCQGTNGLYKRGLLASGRLNYVELPKRRLNVSTPPPSSGISLSPANINASRESWPFPSFPHHARSSLDHPVKSATLGETGSFPTCGEYLPREQRKVRVQSSPSGFKRKLWKPNKAAEKLLLGSDVGLEETCQMALCGFVRHISYHYLAQEPLQAWMEKFWLPSLGYLP